MEIDLTVVLFVAIAGLGFLFAIAFQTSKYQNLAAKFEEVDRERARAASDLSTVRAELTTVRAGLKKVETDFSNYKTETEPLRPILDAKAEAEKIIRLAQERASVTEIQAAGLKSIAETQARILEAKAEKLYSQADQDYKEKLREANQQAQERLKKAQENCDFIMQGARQVAQDLEKQARAKAEEIAGSALEVKENAERYQAIFQAMTHKIKGYGDEWLIPNQSVLDDLAAEYDHTEAGQELAAVREMLKGMVAKGEAATCDYAEPHRRRTAIAFAADAFNGKVETVMAKVKHDNYGKLKKQLEDAFALVNHNGAAFRNARITEPYLDAVLRQLKTAVTVAELKKRDLEEQRAIKEQIREEEKARKEYEKALRDAEKEEKLLQKALAEARKQLGNAAEAERAQFQAKLQDLELKLAEAEARGQRALSMAQQTKRGHVYIISNVGSFGDDVLKIGLTRRLEPLDRVRELGDASVPFSFDVHAMIFSEDAPALERELHKAFQDERLNKINYRKEFFRTPLSLVRDRVDQLGYEIHWTMKAEALEYRESLQMVEPLPDPDLAAVS